MNQELRVDNQGVSKVKVKITFLYSGMVMVREGSEPVSMQDQSRIRAGSGQDQGRIRAGSRSQAQSKGQRRIKARISTG
jgi:hypothetical protein